VSTLLHATVYVSLHNLLNVLVQIANKMGLEKDSLFVCVCVILSLLGNGWLKIIITATNTHRAVEELLVTFI
jgi:hypothetical protein